MRSRRQRKPAKTHAGHVLQQSKPTQFALLMALAGYTIIAQYARIYYLNPERQLETGISYHDLRLASFIWAVALLTAALVAYRRAWKRTPRREMPLRDTP